MVREDIEHNNKKKEIKDFGYAEELNKTLNITGANALAESWKDSLQPGTFVDLADKYNGDELSDAISKMKLNDEYEGAEKIDLTLNGIGNRGLKLLFEELKDKLGSEKKIVLRFNNASLKGIKVFSKELKDKLQPGMKIDFGNNQIGTKGVKVLSKMELKEGVKLDLSRNEIGDKGADALMKNLELKKGVTINLSFNYFSMEKKRELEERVKSYNDKGIDCSVVL